MVLSGSTIEAADNAADSSASSTASASAAAARHSPLRVVVSRDRMTAELRARGERAVTLDEIAAAMSIAGLSPVSQEELAKLLGGGEARRIDEPIIVARGTAPVDDQPVRFELLLSDAVDPNATVSHYDRHHYLTAAAGQVIARVHPRVIGQDGIDVFGKPAPRQKPADERYVLGANVELQADGATVVACSDGRVKFEHGKLWIEPLLLVPGDVDFSVGNIDFACDVHVRGNVLDLFVVKSKQNLIIDATVEAAQVAAGGNLHVGGGICGKDKGHCSAAGNIEFKYATNSHIRSGGNIRAHVEIASSQITCGGLLDISEGAIIGGHVQARGGIKCAVLGSASGTRTVVEAGTDPLLRSHVIDQMKQLHVMQKKIHELRESIAPFVQNQKNLAAQQKQRIAEVLQEITETQASADAIIRDLRAGFEQMRAAARQEVFVAKMVYPGVTVRFPDLECTIEQPIRGPVRIVPHSMRTGVIGCAVSVHSNEAEALPSRPLHDEVMSAAIRALNIPAGPSPTPTA